MGIEKTRGQNYDLGRLLKGVKNGRVALPEFQRSYLWEPSLVRQLLATALNGWPMGSLLLLPGAANRFFDVRAVESAPPIEEPLETIILDGQQRITSLYQALYSTGGYRYAIQVPKLVEASDGGSYGIEDLEEAILAIRVSTWNRRHRQREGHLASGLIPLPALASAASFYDWRDSQENVSDSQRFTVTQLYSRVLSGLDRYEVPAVVIDSEVEPEAIARIFERVNRLGQPLGTFDLMVARSFSPAFNLRNEWELVLERYPKIADYLGADGLPMLSAICLKEKKSVRQSDVLRLSKELVQTRWHLAVRGMEAAIVFMQNRLGVYSPEVVPYKVMLPLLAALFMGQVSADDQRRLERWMWVSMLTGRYDVAANTRAASDYAQLATAGTPEFRSRGVDLFRERLVESSRRQNSALHKSFLCLLCRAGVSDPVSGRPIVLEDGIRSDFFEASIFDGLSNFPAAAKEATLGAVLVLRESRADFASSGLSDLLNCALVSQGLDLHAGGELRVGDLIDQRIAWLQQWGEKLTDMRVSIVKVDPDAGDDDPYWAKGSA